jgi:ArsR family transcriptional regulator
MPKKRLAKDVCTTVCVNHARVQRAKKCIYSEDKLNLLTEIFGAISDNTRVKILLALKREELCVCDIAQVLGASISLVSHQLRILRGLRMVKYRNEGRMVYYSLFDDHIVELIEQGSRHIEEER